MFNITEFHKSTSKEMNAIKDRVRNLIGGYNWGEEGRYKESILINTLRRFIPKTFAVGTGFVIKKTERNILHDSSSQIDLIIYDTAFPLLFSEGDFVILTPEAVRGIIEVKTNIENLSKKKLLEMVEKANNDGKFISEGQLRKKHLFNGIFGYEGYNNTRTRIITQTKSFLSESVKKHIFSPNSDFYLLNHFCFNNKYFLRYWRNEYSYSLYDLEDLSFSFFISNIIFYLSEQRIQHESNLWFPIEKEGRKKHSFKFVRKKGNINLITE